MTLKRKLGIAATLVAVVVAITLCWPKPKGYTYQGKTVEQWFEEYVEKRTISFGTPRSSLQQFAFREMGTNAVPFLVHRYLSRSRPSLIERFAPPFTSQMMYRRGYEVESAFSLLMSLPPDTVTTMVIPMLGTNHANRAYLLKHFPPRTSRVP